MGHAGCINAVLPVPCPRANADGRRIKARIPKKAVPGCIKPPQCLTRRSCFPWQPIGFMVLSKFTFFIFACVIPEVQINVCLFSCYGDNKKYAWNMHLYIMYSCWMYLTLERSRKIWGFAEFKWNSVPSKGEFW